MAVFTGTDDRAGPTYSRALGMSAAEQKDCGVLVGRDYPVPVVEHAAARTAAVELYGKAQG